MSGSNALASSPCAPVKATMRDPCRISLQQNEKKRSGFKTRLAFQANRKFITAPRTRFRRAPPRPRLYKSLHAMCVFYNINPSFLPFNQSIFSFRPLNWEFFLGGGAYRSRSELRRPQRVGSRPPALNERGLWGEIREASACVAAFCLPGERGPAEHPPSPTHQRRNTMGNKEVARSSTLARTHHSPLSYKIYIIWKLQSGVGGGGVSGEGGASLQLCRLECETEHSRET